MEVLPMSEASMLPPATTYVLDDPKLDSTIFFLPFFIVFSTHELFL